MSDLFRPIIGIENRTAQEVFDIMCDRFRPALTAYEAAKGGGVDASFPTALSDSEVRIWINACNHEPARQALRQLLAYRVRGVSSALTSPASGEQDAPVGYVLVPQAAIDWLMGEGPDPAGLWFGDFPDDHPKPPGAFWWRSLFRSMLAKVKPQKDNDDGAAGKITGWAVVGADDLSGGILWECHDEADKGDTESLEKIELAADRFPIGTKVVITEPALRMEGK